MRFSKKGSPFYPEGSADNVIFMSVYNIPVKRVNLTRDDSLRTFITKFCVRDF